MEEVHKSSALCKGRKMFFVPVKLEKIKVSSTYSWIHFKTNGSVNKGFLFNNAINL